MRKLLTAAAALLALQPAVAVELESRAFQQTAFERPTDAGAKPSPALLPFASPMLLKPASSGGYTDWRVDITDNHGSATFIEIVELKFYDSTGSEIAATGGTPLKSSESLGNEASKAFDGTNSSWASASGSVTNQYLGYSWPSAKPVAKVGITPTLTSIDRAPKNCTLKYYDGTTWQTAATFKFTWPVLGVARIFPEAALATGYHRAFRLFIPATAGGTQTQIVEIEMRATPGGADQTTNLGSNAGNTNGRVIGSSIAAGGNEGYRAFDNVLTTSGGWFAGSGTNQWVAFVFPTPVKVEEFTVLGSSNTARSPTSLSLDSSDDQDLGWNTERSASSLTFAAGETKTFSVP